LFKEENMLAEIFLYLATPAPLAIRRSGLVTSAVSLWSRANRCRKAWADHEQRCHKVVLKAMEALPQRRRVFVLGSGLLRDVPIHALVKAFEEVVLIDAVHLLPIRLRYAFSRNILFRIQDLTGQFLSDPSFNDEPCLDLVISANVLSQLALPFTDNKPMARAVIARHIADLQTLSKNARICLLTDIFCQTGNERLDLLHGFALSEAEYSWDWPVAPVGERSDGQVTIHHVHAWSNWRG
jgi:hypothetical protein